MGWQLIKIFYIFTIASLVACGSKLAREKKVNHLPLAQKVDLSKVTFLDLETQKPVTALQYMQNNDLQHLLLVFGSVGCGICNEKAKELSSQYVGKHPLLLQSKEHKFALVGVNTDSGAARQRFLGLMANDKTKTDRGYHFILWADPQGKTMSKSLLGKNQRFGVPFTVLLNRKGILWRYHNNETYRWQDLFKQVEDTLAGRKGEIKKNERSRRQVPAIGIHKLAFAHEDRFSEIEIETCGKEKQNLQSLQTENGFLFVQVTKDACALGSICEQNHRQLEQMMATCSNCSFITLTQISPAAERCQSGNVALGGREFYEVFATHFNWAYEPLVDEFGSPAQIPETKQPWVLGFNLTNQQLIYSWEGTLPSLPKGSDTPVSGAHFRVYDGNSEIDFGDTLLKEKKYTVVNAFDRFCGSCLEELADWSQELKNFCSAEDEGRFCHVLALEGELSIPNTRSAQEKFFNEIRNDFFAPAHVNIPLLIDTQSWGEGYSRFFQSYLSPLFPNWQGVYGSVIYDSEGKILANFKSIGVQYHDPVLETLKALRKYDQAFEDP